MTTPVGSSKVPQPDRAGIDSPAQAYQPVPISNRSDSPRSSSPLTALPQSSTLRSRTDDDEDNCPRGLRRANSPETARGADQASSSQASRAEAVAASEAASEAEAEAEAEAGLEASAEASALRDGLQAALLAFAERPNGLEGEALEALQNAAHAALRNYSELPGTSREQLFGTAHGTLLVGANALIAFGGRGCGVALADGFARGGANDAGYDLVRDASMPAMPTGIGPQFNTVMSGYVLGSVIGGGCNFLTQKFAVPALNAAAPRSLQAISAEVIVPDEMVRILNELDDDPDGGADGGRGDRLLKDVRSMIANVQDFDSPWNVLAGQLFFGVPAALTAGVTAAYPQPQRGVASAALIGAGTSMAGGLLVGGAMAVRKLRAQVRVPDLDLLRRAHQGQASAAEALDENNWKSVSLFYSHHRTGSFMADVKAGFGYKSYTDMGKSITYRMAGMAQASASITAGVFLARAVALSPNSTPSWVIPTVAAAAAFAGLWPTIPIWFDSVVRQFPANDKAHKAPAPTTLPPGQQADVGDPPDDSADSADLESGGVVDEGSGLEADGVRQL